MASKDVSPVRDAAAMAELWESRWPGVRPVGHELRALKNEWVRFHSLPESKRYAETETEYAEIFSRHLTVLGELAELCPAGSTDLLVITVAWSKSPGPKRRAKRLREAFPAGDYWQAVPYDLSDPDLPTWLHLYAAMTPVDSPDLLTLLRLVADDGTRDAVIASPELDWLYHPYDGGADVIAPDTDVRDLLRARHPSWLSPTESGL